MVQYNSQSGNYQDELPDGSTMIVDAEAEVSNPSNWTEDMFGVEIKK